jgi:hypothetical protein
VLTKQINDLSKYASAPDRMTWQGKKISPILPTGFWVFGFRFSSLEIPRNTNRIEK